MHTFLKTCTRIRGLLENIFSGRAGRPFQSRRPESTASNQPLRLSRHKSKEPAFLRALWELLVPRRGLEPPHLAAHGPEPCASTNSATWALCFGVAVKINRSEIMHSFFRLCNSVLDFFIPCARGRPVTVIASGCDGRRGGGGLSLRLRGQGATRCRRGSWPRRPFRHVQPQCPVLPAPAACAPCLCACARTFPLSTMPCASWCCSTPTKRGMR